DGDLDDYRRLGATQRRGRAQDDAKTTDRSESAPSLDRREERRRRAETRVATKPLRESLRAAERRLEDLSKEKAALEAKLADPALYQTAPRDAAQLNIRLADVARATAEAEATWLAAAEALENAD
ncbi:MAG: ABC transporter ATP-binding protein, partial [Pseudomonadota bacterium]